MTDKQIAQRFSSHVARLHVESGLTLREIAEQVGCTTDFIAKLKRGDRLPSWETVIAFARVFRVTPNYFLKAPPKAKMPQ